MPERIRYTAVILDPLTPPIEPVTGDIEKAQSGLPFHAIGGSKGLPEDNVIPFPAAKPGSGGQ